MTPYKNADHFNGLQIFCEEDGVNYAKPRNRTGNLDVLTTALYDNE
jgi:hypothetical protein